jgi:RNA polymerase sigma factor (sigma-70 family)
MKKVDFMPGYIIRSVSAGNMDVLDQVYDAYRNDFIDWAGQRLQIENREKILDAWHEIMIMFYEQIRDKKLTKLTCELRTYLFAMGYRRLIEMHKKNGKIELLEDILANHDINEGIDLSELEEIKDQREKLLVTSIDELPDQTRQILIKRFMGKKSIPQIAKELGYESENLVSIILSRGINQLKKLILERMVAQRE